MDVDWMRLALKRAQEAAEQYAWDWRQVSSLLDEAELGWDDSLGQAARSRWFEPSRAISGELGAASRDQLDHLAAATAGFAEAKDHETLLHGAFTDFRAASVTAGALIAAGAQKTEQADREIAETNRRSDLANQILAEI